jgi:hypothetical protein
MDAASEHLFASLRRNIPERVFRAITASPQERPLVVDFKGTAKKKLAVSISDIRANQYLLRAVVETFPDRIPGAHVIAKALRLLDEHYNGDVFRSDRKSDLYDEVLLMDAYRIKCLVQKLRRYFRRSRSSRSMGNGAL